MPYTGPMTKTITAAEALSLLTKAVEKKGADYVYPDSMRYDQFSTDEDGMKTEALIQKDQGACRYFIDGEPACIVGHVFADLGITEDDLSAPFFGAYQSNVFLNATAGVVFTGTALEMLNMAQNTQDRQYDERNTWADALRSAETFLDETGEE